MYAAPDIFAARIGLERFFDRAAHVEVAEVTRLATTIDRWCTAVTPSVEVALVASVANGRQCRLAGGALLVKTTASQKMATKLSGSTLLAAAYWCRTSHRVGCHNDRAAGVSWRSGSPDALTGT